MISKDAAEAMATGLLAQERGQTISERNRHAHYVNPLFRVPELKAYEPWERASVLTNALRQARRGWLGILLSVLIIAYVSGFIIFNDWVHRHVSMPLAWALFLALYGLMIMMLRIRVRRILRVSSHGPITS
jgi:undecaprenyl pyrophosphate phosphatase UppP